MFLYLSYSTAEFCHEKLIVIEFQIIHKAKIVLNFSLCIAGNQLQERIHMSLLSHFQGDRVKNVAITFLNPSIELNLICSSEAMLFKPNQIYLFWSCNYIFRRRYIHF